MVAPPLGARRAVRVSTSTVDRSIWSGPTAASSSWFRKWIAGRRSAPRPSQRDHEPLQRPAGDVNRSMPDATSTALDQLTPPVSALECGRQPRHRMVVDPPGNVRASLGPPCCTPGEVWELRLLIGWRMIPPRRGAQVVRDRHIFCTPTRSERRRSRSQSRFLNRTPRRVPTDRHEPWAALNAVTYGRPIAGR